MTRSGRSVQLRMLRKVGVGVGGPRTSSMRVQTDLAATKRVDRILAIE